MTSKLSNLILLAIAAIILLFAGWDFLRIGLVLLILSLLIFPFDKNLIRSAVLLLFLLAAFSFLINRLATGERFAILGYFLLATHVIKQLYIVDLDE